MNKNKLTLFTVFFIFLAAFSSYAASGSITFSDPSVTLGNEVNVSMKIKSEDGALSRADIGISYDVNALEFISGTDAEGGSGSIHIQGASNGAGTGTLSYNLRFRALAAGSTPVRISSQQVFDTNEAQVNITHEGSSAVKIVTEAMASNDASLQSLDVSPGTLSPGFSQNIMNYSITVGTDVGELQMNPVPSNSSAVISVDGNGNLAMGENHVIITVTAPDGSTKNQYDLRVIKQEGGPSAANSGNNETTNEGVKLSGKAKNITIMNPGMDVEIPEGFVGSNIDIDGHQVKGWIWKTDTDHQYCIFYGMNDAGDLEFYRYDLGEKTLQRYFKDPVGEDIQQKANDYSDLIDKYDSLVSRYNFQFILSCILGTTSLLLALFLIIHFITKKKGKNETGQVSLSNNSFQERTTSAERIRSDHSERNYEPKTWAEEFNQTKSFDRGMMNEPGNSSEAISSRSMRRFERDMNNADDLNTDKRMMEEIKRQEADRQEASRLARDLEELGVEEL